MAAEHARLESLRLAAVEGRFAALLDAGRHAEAVGDLADAASAHPSARAVYRAAHAFALSIRPSGRSAACVRRAPSAVGLGHRCRARRRAARARGQRSSVRMRRSICKPAAPPSGNLPTALTSFVGRESDLAAIAQEVSDNRFVTLTGPGGVGKTRLAVQLGSEIGDRYPGGVWLVDLAAGAQRRHGARCGRDRARHRRPPRSRRVRRARQPRTHGVLRASSCSTTASIWSRRSASSSLASFRCAGMPLCSRPAVGRSESRGSTCDRCPRSRPRRRCRCSCSGPVWRELATSRATRSTRSALDSIGSRSRIELAASQLRVLGLVEIAARLQDQLQFRGRGSEESPRQRTLNDMVAWSHDLLPADTQRAFARLGVFASSFTLEAAEAVCGVGALGHITTLVDHSLLARVPTSTSSLSRYRMLETLRLFALDRLVASGADELDAARRAHADFYRRMAMRAGEHLWGADEQLWRLDLEAEEPNIHAALGWAEDNDPEFALRFAVALWPYWDLRWGERKGVAYVRGVLDRPDLDVDDALRAWALTVSADLSANPGDARQSIPWATEAIAIFRELGDDLGLRHALLALGIWPRQPGTARRGRRRAGRGHRARTRARRQGRDRTRAESRLVHRFAAWQASRSLPTSTVKRSRAGPSSGASGEKPPACAISPLRCSRSATSTKPSGCAIATLEIWTELDDPTSIVHVRATLGDIARRARRLRQCERAVQRSDGGVRRGRRSAVHGVDVQELRGHRGAAQRARREPRSVPSRPRASLRARRRGWPGRVLGRPRGFVSRERARARTLPFSSGPPTRCARRPAPRSPSMSGPASRD